VFYFTPQVPKRVGDFLSMLERKKWRQEGNVISQSHTANKWQAMPAWLKRLPSFPPEPIKVFLHIPRSESLTIDQHILFSHLQLYQAVKANSC
jgi:hypothetical protein